MSIENYAILVSAETAETARAMARELPADGDEHYRRPDVQAFLRDALGRAVPGWKSMVAQIEETFVEDGLVLLRGLRFDSENRLLVGLIASLGRPVGDGNPRGRVVYDLYPIERPPGATDFELYFHTGSPAQARPHEILALECVAQSDRGGGISKLTLIDAAVENMRRCKQRTAIKTLCERAFPFKSFRHETIFYAPIVEQAAGPEAAALRVRFQRDLIFNGAAAEPESFDDSMSAAMEAFEKALSEPGNSIEYLLREGELLIINNRRVLHARTAIVGGKESGRHLKRVKAYRP
jgi:alpha-ketoglutarate-dependent taurine dioxygenase